MNKPGKQRVYQSNNQYSAVEDNTLSFDNSKEDKAVVFPPIQESKLGKRDKKEDRISTSKN